MNKINKIILVLALMLAGVDMGSAAEVQWNCVWAMNNTNPGTVDVNGNGYLVANGINLTVKQVPRVNDVYTTYGYIPAWDFSGGDSVMYSNTIPNGLKIVEDENTDHVVRTKVKFGDYLSNDDWTVLMQKPDSWSVEISPDKYLSLYVDGVEHESSCQVPEYYDRVVADVTYDELLETISYDVDIITPGEGGDILHHSCNDKVQIVHYVQVGKNVIYIGQDLATNGEQFTGHIESANIWNGKYTQ